MTPMIRSPDQSGAHIAERIWCRRIDSPAGEALVRLGVEGDQRHPLLHHRPQHGARDRHLARGAELHLVLDPRQLADQLARVVRQQDEAAVDRKGLERQVEHPREHVVHRLRDGEHAGQAGEEAEHPVDVGLVLGLRRSARGGRPRRDLACRGSARP